MRSMIVALDPYALTVEAAASALGLTTGRVRQLLRAGVLVGEKVTERCWLISRASVEAYRSMVRRPGPKPVQNS